MTTAARMGHPTVLLDTVDSTSDEARRRAQAGAPHGTLVVARAQTAGRGRRGRSWSAITGEQFLGSFVLRPALPAARAAELTLVAAAALADTLASFGAVPRIKWPNDLELDGRKVAGILCELATDTEGGLDHVVLGVGVNLGGTADALPGELRDRATTLEASGRVRPDAHVFRERLCEALDVRLARHAAEGLDPVLADIRGRSSTLGERVRVTLADTVLEGRAVDLAADGALLVEDDAGRRHRIDAGEVERLRRAVVD